MKLLILLLFPVLSLAQTNTSKKLSLLDGKVEIIVSTELSDMSNDLWKKKYGATPKPFLAMSDKPADVSLVGQYTNQSWDESDLLGYKDFRVANLKKTRNDVEIVGEGVKETNGRKLGYLKFLSNATDAKIFNYYFFTTVEGRILLFNLNCTEALRKDWEKAADEMASSLTVK